MKVLITGATGLLGGHLLLALQQGGEQMRALVLPSENAEKLSVEKARSELSYEPQVDIREGIKLTAAWFNAGGIGQPVVSQVNQYTSLGGNRKQ